MTVAKPTLPASVYDALVAADSSLVADYNRAAEAEPPAPVAVVVNVNLNYSMDPMRYVTDSRGAMTQYPNQSPTPDSIAASVERVRVAVTDAMRVAS